MKSRIEEIEKAARAALAEASGVKALKELSVEYLGRKGKVTALLRGLGSLPPEERRDAGQMVNALSDSLTKEFDEAEKRLLTLEQENPEDALDVTLPGAAFPVGRMHPLTQVLDEICDAFIRMGFGVAKGPEVELDWYNFEALNFPPDHPARDMQDTFFISEKVVLRTHTSPLQVRTMEKTAPPVRVIAPGKVYRCDSDNTHTPMFHQVEGLVVDKGIGFSDLKGCLSAFIKQMFGPKVPLRFRPSFFPFTEPSAEVDMGCVMCGGKGCRVCKDTGWLEILGSGMVHPAVFENVGYDTSVYTGFAFGMGVERMAMLKYGIDDLRRFFENDVRFLAQF
ncbi:MAG: phenylalanine--tRNA ligase subunit alpha [Deltaproteobacteria bacterium]|nr:phenylalanine--tRNA ligase subunit alpha [Deltaproteobacteria bacterium]